MPDFDEIHRQELAALHWALKLPSIRDGRGARDRAAHELLHFLALHADFKTGEGAFPSVQAMAEAIGADRAFVRRKLATLEQLGLIQRMDVEEIAELLEERKAAQGKAVPTSWADMPGGTQDYYARRFDPEDGGQSAWSLAIDDAQVWNELEKAEHERQLVAQEKTRARHKRHNHLRYGTPPPDCDALNTVAKGRSVATVVSPSYDALNTVVRRGNRRRTTASSPSYDGQNGVVRRRVDPLSPIDPQGIAQGIATDRPGTRRPPAALDGRCAGEPGFVRGHAAALAAGMVTAEDLAVLDYWRTHLVVETEAMTAAGIHPVVVHPKFATEEDR